jgi:hypothetical protein
MKYNRRAKRGRSESDNDETLRGMVRELQKMVRQLQSENKYLKKQLDMANTIISPKEEEPEPPAKNMGKKCPKCASHNFSEVTVWKPNRNIEFLVCQNCLHREKK